MIEMSSKRSAVKPLDPADNPKELHYVIIFLTLDLFDVFVRSYAMHGSMIMNGDIRRV
jgi:hypothetical protein